MEEYCEKLSTLTPDQFYKLIMTVCSAYINPASAVPVVHGRLVDKYSGEYNDFGHCSVCGALNLDGSKLCCQCGACMNGEEAPHEH